MVRFSGFRAMVWAGVVASVSPGCRTDRSPTSPGVELADADYEGPPKRVLVELFSSQGCNSCPPADALIGELPSRGFERDAVVALTYHVTYWDDLGWQDPYASALFDQRQITYAQRVPSGRAQDESTMRGPYTPQMVVDGRVHFSGSLRELTLKRIGEARQQPTSIEFETSAKLAPDRSVAVHVSARKADGAQFDTDRTKVAQFAALAQRTVNTEVPRGENAGKRLTEHWVVRDFGGPKLFRSARAVNQTEFTLTLPDDVEGPEDLEVVVFAQDLGDLHVMGVDAVSVVSSSVP